MMIQFTSFCISVALATYSRSILLQSRPHKDSNPDELNINSKHRARLSDIVQSKSLPQFKPNLDATKLTPLAPPGLEFTNPTYMDFSGIFTGTEKQPDVFVWIENNKGYWVKDAKDSFEFSKHGEFSIVGNSILLMAGTKWMRFGILNSFPFIEEVNAK